MLLVDDGSRDRSTEIARKLAVQDPLRIRYFQHEEHRNRGQAASRNVGLNNARGEYIAILDLDDVWLQGKLQEQIEIMKSYPEAALVCGLSQYWYGWTARTEDAERDFVESVAMPTDRIHEPPSLVSKRMNFEWCPCPSDLMLNREALIRLGGFEEKFNGMYGMYEDQALMTKLPLKRRYSSPGGAGRNIGYTMIPCVPCKAKRETLWLFASSIWNGCDNICRIVVL